MSPARIVRIFASSPSDVANEREQLANVVAELNTTLRVLVPENPIVLELIRWETHVHPDAGDDAQEVVARQIGDYEVFLGIMWSRFGTPTTRAGSGTEEEFRTAYQGWLDRRVPSHVLFYFCTDSIPADVVWKEAAQLAQVGHFREELSHRGLVWHYASRSVFADTVRPHLVSVMAELVRAEDDPRIGAPGALQVSESDRAAVRAQIAELAAEYEGLRKAMEAGDARTRRMEVIASRMRTLARSTIPLLSDLTDSASPGERLAAITALQEVPDAAWLRWLADRFAAGVETPFVGYHAALALLAAARGLGPDELPEVRRALNHAAALASRLRRDTDRATTLRHAEDELLRREGTPAVPP
jgi:hypothetical protein